MLKDQFTKLTKMFIYETTKLNMTVLMTSKECTIQLFFTQLVVKRLQLQQMVISFETMIFRFFAVFERGEGWPRMQGFRDGSWVGFKGRVRYLQEFNLDQHRMWSYPRPVRVTGEFVQKSTDPRHVHKRPQNRHSP